MTKGKKYSEWTAEEKASYKAKRDAYWTKRNEDAVNGFKALEEELTKLKAPQHIMDLLANTKKSAGFAKGEGASNRETYLTAIFGSETPNVGTKATYLYIGVRGPNGERMLEGEKMGAFVTRVGDCVYKYDANTISSMVWYLKKRGHKVTNDRDASFVRYDGFEKIEETKVEKPKAELIKAK